MDGRLAIVGTGRMGQALLGGLLGTGTLRAEQITCTDPDARRRDEVADAHGVAVTDDNHAAVSGADVVLLAVKPQLLLDVLDTLDEALAHRPLVISIAAGLGTGTLEAHLPASTPVVRVMPNTPAMVDEGMSLVCAGRAATDAHLTTAADLLGAVGEVATVSEAQMDAGSAVSGSGPAYVFLLAEAMIDAGVRQGLPRELAEQLVVQTLRGSATLLRDSGEHPGRLREAVTSPGGTTAQALHRLEAAGLRAAVAEAIEAAHRRAEALGG